MSLSNDNIDTTFCDRLIRLSCHKMLQDRYRKGGARLHKNLLIMKVLREAREEQRRLEDMEQQMLISETLFEDEYEEFENPPLEFSVKDDEDGIPDDAPLVFATEATENDYPSADEEEQVYAPAALSSAINEALARLGAAVDRKRKPIVPRAQPQKKTFKPEATVRVNTVVCK